MAPVPAVPNLPDGHAKVIRQAFHVHTAGEPVWPTEGHKQSFEMPAVGVVCRAAKEGFVQPMRYDNVVWLIDLNSLATTA